MFYRCKSCGGNVVYHPGKKKMVCESCGNEETQQVIEQKELHVCNNCGAQLDVPEHNLACRCPYCQTYIILEDRMEEQYKPDLILPFRLDKHKAAEILRKNFAGKLFLPNNFCSVSSLEAMEGLYVPFWMYDFRSHVEFEGEGSIIRTWREGDYECTETRIYRVIRDFQVDYRKIPVDASISMEDGLMDLLEPYQYEELGDFVPEYLSGFRADIYEEDSDALESRAGMKADAFSEDYLRELNQGYASVRPLHNRKNNQRDGAFYAFLPVWRYVYRYNGKDYEFFVNGQTGKAIGSPPVSKMRVFTVSAATFVSIFFCLKMLFYLLEVL